MNNLIDELYQDLILEHARKPRHFEKMEDYTHHAKAYNPICSDEVDIYIKVENNVIKKISFIGHGCVLSQASASMLTDYLQDKSILQFNTVFSHFREFLINETIIKDENTQQFKVFSGVKHFPMRVKCVTLAWHAVHSALNKENDE